ncbi:venom acid phosphatase Acph-1-like [Calliphora vicina]|uniref:venom acid phosphatase Acph-1-like n=1 Tax=Calliphora vicina TaxID=7373 RepID=UPI00325BF9B4
MKSPCTTLLLIILMYLIRNLPVRAAETAALKGVEHANQSTLKLAHVLFRHGIRTPVNTYANDPYKNGTFFPYGWGHLTNDGKRDLFEMGKWLGRRYQDFVALYYKPDLVYARSTASPRTLMSMATVLAGMFPPSNTPMEWNPKMDWQPIPIFSEPLDKDITLRMQTECKAYTEMKNNLENFEDPEGLFEQLTELTGDNVTKADDVNSIFITLWAEQLYGLELPEWTLDYYPDKMRFMAEQSYADLGATTEMQRLKAGPFLQSLMQQMLDKINGTLKPLERKMFLYSAHDWTITNVLIGLKVWKRQMPNFAALILFELHQDMDTQEYYMELYYQNGPKSSLEPLTLPGCIFQCPLAKVMELLQDVLPTGTYDEMCGNE